MENNELRTKAREALSGNWGLAIGVTFVYMLIVGGLGSIPLAGQIGSILIAGPMALGMAIFVLSLARNQEAKFDQLFQGFQNFGTALGAYVLMLIYVLLWSLLLIVPGIIAAIGYSQVFYILAEDNTIGITEALKKSKSMMDGYKMKYFFMMLVFFGWSLLCILTLGIGFLWLIPYMYVSYANFYDDIKNNKIAS